MWHSLLHWLSYCWGRGEELALVLASRKGLTTQTSTLGVLQPVHLVVLQQISPSCVSKNNWSLNGDNLDSAEASQSSWANPLLMAASRSRERTVTVELEQKMEFSLVRKVFFDSQYNMMLVIMTWYPNESQIIRCSGCRELVLCIVHLQSSSGAQSRKIRGFLQRCDS